MEATAKKITVVEWRHEPFEKFIGLDSENTSFAIGLTPIDPAMPSCCYFNVGVTNTCANDTNGVVFLGECKVTFRIHNRGARPSAEFLFSLIVEAGSDFASIYHERTAGTNLAHHNILKPRFQAWKRHIEGCIDTWDRTIRDVWFD